MIIPPPPAAPRGPQRPASTLAIIALFARLRWRLLRGSMRHGGPQSIATVVSLLFAAGIGTVGSVLIVVGARSTNDPEPWLVLFPLALVVVVIALGVIAGVAQPVDPRIIGSEPLSDRQLATGLLTTSAFGPPGIAASLLGIGLLAGSVNTIGGLIAGLVALAAFLATMLLVSRTTVNLLGLFSNRFPRSGQVTIGLASLAFYGALQFVPQAFARVDSATRRDVADIARLTPPGQIGQAFADADNAPLIAIGHAALGALWLPLLAVVFMVTTRRVILSSGSRSNGPETRSTTLVGRLARWACGPGAVGAIAWRSVRTRMRHPRTALETFVGAGIGLAVVLVPALTRDDVGASAVLVGGAVQLSVLFMAGNSIGSDGPALGAEIMCGLEPDVIVAAKVRSVIVVASPLAVIGPLIAAGVTGEWAYVPAGVAVGCAGLLAGAGGAIAQSTFVPIAVPESDNPLASGDSGSGLLAALVLALVLISLAIITLPFALALIWALTLESVPLVTAFALLTLAGGWGTMRLGRRLASQRWRGGEAELYAAIIPSS
jgi:ABC-2 type transport system permease protein